MKKSKLLIAVWLSVLAGAGTPNINANNIGYAKELVYNFDNTQKWDTKKINSNNDIDLSSHEEIINTDVSTILESLWYEKWIEVIRQHFLEEINMYRVKNNIVQLKLDSTLNEAAQRFADHWSEHHALWHSFDDKSVRDMWVDLSDLYQWGENVAYGQNTIFDVTEARYNRSEWHKKTMLWLHKSKYTWEPMTYNHLWIGFNWEFFVAEFWTK